MDANRGNVTRMLAALSAGDRGMIEQLFPIVYRELRGIAANHIRGERPGHTLQATELVNEAYLKLIAQEALNFQNRAHFFAVASQAMRQILVDYARQRAAARRGGGKPNLSLDDTAVFSEERATHLLALDEALTHLVELDAQQGKIVELRYFTGLSIEETAEVLGISTATVKREWRMARAWLHRQLNSE